MKLNVELKNHRKLPKNTNLLDINDIKKSPGVYSVVDVFEGEFQVETDKVVNINNVLFLHLDEEHVEVMDNLHWEDFKSYKFFYQDSEKARIEFQNEKSKKK